MREQIAGPVEVKAGQAVHLHASLRKGENYAYLQVFSSAGGAQPSPHVDSYKLDIKKDDNKPSIVSPTSIRLTREMRPSAEVTVRVTEDCEIYLMQDIDVKGDPLAKGKILKDDKFYRFYKAAYEASRWLSRRRKR